jgi:hypothetical protein
VYRTRFHPSSGSALTLFSVNIWDEFKLTALAGLAEIVFFAVVSAMNFALLVVLKTGRDADDDRQNRQKQLNGVGILHGSLRESASSRNCVTGLGWFQRDEVDALLSGPFVAPGKNSAAEIPFFCRCGPVNNQMQINR